MESTTDHSAPETEEDPRLAGASFAAPDGTVNNECTRDRPCDWRTATWHAGSGVVALLDGTYVIPENEVWCVRNAATVLAVNRWAAHVAFEGSAPVTGDADGACSIASGFGFGLHGTLDGLEITAPARWSAVDAYGLPDGRRSKIVKCLIHDINVVEQLYSSEHGNCVNQGVVDLEGGADLENTIIYRAGQRTGVDTIRSSPTLKTCINYHAVYVTLDNIVRNNLIVDLYGGWCVHGYQPEHVGQRIERNTLIGCHQGGVILPMWETNHVNNNVIVRGHKEPASILYGFCIYSYSNASWAPERLINNVCRDNPHDAILHWDGSRRETDILNATAIVDPVLVDVTVVDERFDDATSPEAQMDVARGLSVDRTMTGGAGYVFVP